MIKDEALEMKRFVSDTYVKDVNDFTHRRRLYLKLEFDATDDYNRFEEELTWSIYYVGKYDVDDNTTIVTFNIPEVYYEDYDLIMAGKFSETSDTYKFEVEEFHELTSFSYVFGVLYRQEFAYKIVEARINKGLERQHWTLVPRTQEIGSIFNIERETFSQRVGKEIKQ